MTQITFNDQLFESQLGESVLNTLLRHNQSIPYGCKAGVCQSCLMCCLDDVPSLASAQVGLTDTQQKQQYFLSCLCLPEKAMSVALPTTSQTWLDAKVVDKRPLSSNVIQLTLQIHEPLPFLAGQFVNLRNKAGVIRSYSIANPPNAQHTLVFHIRVLPHGQFTRWLSDALEVGMTLDVSPAQGGCHYIKGNPEQSLLLIGTGPGLAPLYGILCDALDNHQHQGDIHLFHGSRNATGLYFEDTLSDLAQKHSNFHYTPCLSEKNSEAPYAQGRANNIALQQFSQLAGWRVYLCGQADMVAQTKKMAYLQGASLKAIYADAFFS